jgi:hypothetical protein
MVDVLNAFKLETNEALVTASEGTFRACTSSSIFSFVFGLASLRFVFGLVRCVLDFL